MSKRRKDTDASCFAAFTGGLATCLGLVSASMLFSYAEGRSSFGAVGVVVGVVAALLFAFSLISYAEHSRILKTHTVEVDAKAFGKPVIRIRSRLRCPYCHDSVGGETFECAGCKAIYHVECLQEARGCTTLGCAHVAPRRTVRL